MNQEIKQALSFYLDQLHSIGIEEVWKGKEPDIPKTNPSTNPLELMKKNLSPSVSTQTMPTKRVSEPVSTKQASTKDVRPQQGSPLQVEAVTVPPIPSVFEPLRNEIGDCQRCKLCKERTHIVFGIGNPQASLMFVGEGPGADEDAKGEPFVGRAGQLLTKMIEAMGLTRDKIYIANVVKCRPPNNRNPEPDEIEACIPFLKKQIATINPKVIVCLGTFASKTLLQTEIPITKLRGEFRDYEKTTIKVMPTYHPAFLLRNPNMKRPVWEDLKKVMDFLGLKLPETQEVK